jgi:hypothetical protein
MSALRRRAPATLRQRSHWRRVLAVGLLSLGACGHDSGTGPGQSTGARGDIVASTLVRSLPKSAVAAFIAEQGGEAAFQAKYDVEQYAIAYRTVDADGAPVTATGAVWIPVGASGAVPLMSYSHGTVTVKSDVPSSPTSLEGLAVGALNASHGSVVALADYLGLGGSADLVHPYLHAATEASAGLDALRAARRVAQSKGLALDGHLFVFGYSQGGHAAMALHREIELHDAGEFTVTASAPMSGPYDLTSTALDYLSLDTPNSAGSLYTVYVAAAYNSVYHIADRLDALVRPPYDTLATRLVTQGLPSGDLEAALAPVPRDNLQPAVVDAALSDPDSPLRRALRDNDVYDWHPSAPVRLYYATADERVPYQNALTAAARMQALGATVDAVDVGPLSHGAAVIPAFIGAREWFDTFLK